MKAVRKSQLGTRPRDLAGDPWAWLAFGGGTGLLPYGPGTWGAVLGVLLAWLIKWGPVPLYATVTALVALSGIWITGHTAARLGVHDHPGINYDEIAGQLVAAALMPRSWIWIGISFCLFRFFDIAKPWPICVIDRRITGGFGIMADDIVAGLVAGLLSWVIYLALLRTGGSI